MYITYHPHSLHDTSLAAAALYLFLDIQVLLWDTSGLRASSRLACSVTLPCRHGKQDVLLMISLQAAAAGEEGVEFVQEDASRTEPGREHIRGLICMGSEFKPWAPTVIKACNP